MKKIKIVFIAESLVPHGGTEKILTEKANYLSDNFGYDITIITCTQPNEQPNAFPLSKTVRQINLSIPYYRQYRYRYPKRLWVKQELNKQLKKAITESILQLNPDITICTAGFKADIINTIGCRAKKITECHEARYFVMADLDRRRTWFSRLYMNLYKRKKYFQTIEKNADVVVTLTEGDKQLWRKAKHVEVIPNFSTMQVSQFSDSTNKRIIAVGRLSPEKGYERLIEIWKSVSPQFPEWSLDIFGEGKLHDELTSTIQNANLKNIHIHNATSDISEEYAKSSICVMSSYLEGFGLVLLEAMKHGIPCVAFDCPFGPGSIIKDDQCGFLVDDSNIPLFAEKLGLLMKNENTRKSFSAAAIERSKDFSVDSIMNKWKQLFENLLKT